MGQVADGIMIPTMDNKTSWIAFSTSVYAGASEVRGRERQSKRR